MANNKSYNKPEYISKLRLAALGSKNGRYKIKNNLPLKMKYKKCIICGNITRNLKFCSNSCKYKHIAKQNEIKNRGCFHNAIENRKVRINTYKNRGQRWTFNNISFDSRAEMEFAMNIHYQIEPLKLHKNYQIPIKRKSIDFLIKKFKCFIEYHALREESFNSYYSKRRKILNCNGFKDYNLLVIIN